jgi:hypothetical protein
VKKRRKQRRHAQPLTSNWADLLPSAENPTDKHLRIDNVTPQNGRFLKRDGRPAAVNMTGLHEQEPSSRSASPKTKTAPGAGRAPACGRIRKRGPARGRDLRAGDARALQAVPGQARYRWKASRLGTACDHGLVAFRGARVLGQRTVIGCGAVRLRVPGVGDLKRSLVCVVRPGCGVRRRTGLARGPMIA